MIPRDPRAEALLRRFVEIEGAEEVVATYRDDDSTETVRRPHATVRELLPERGVVVDHATREQHPSGWWTLRDCWFEPSPPGEVTRRR